MKKNRSGSHISQRTDPMHRRVYLGKNDGDMLYAKSEAKHAKESLSIEYIRAELIRILENRCVDPKLSRIANCERIKRDTIKMIQRENNTDKEEIEKTCDNMVKSLIVEAVLKCRAEKKNYVHPFLLEHVKYAYKKYFGKEM